MLTVLVHNLTKTVMLLLSSFLKTKVGNHMVAQTPLSIRTESICEMNQLSRYTTMQYPYCDVYTFYCGWHSLCITYSPCVPVQLHSLCITYSPCVPVQLHSLCITYSPCVPVQLVLSHCVVTSYVYLECLQCLHHFVVTSYVYLECLQCLHHCICL